MTQQLPPAQNSGGEIVRIPFHGDEVATVAVDGKPGVVFKGVVENLGLAYSSQLRKIRRQAWARVSLTDIRDSAGRLQETVVIDLRTLLMWLSGITASRVAEHARPKLERYQSEVADVIEAYWTKGGAINPRATEEQLARIAGIAERRIAVLRAAAGLVDPAWLEAKTRHEVARGLGEAPEIEWNKTPLTVGEYLEENGIKGAEQRSMASMFGKRVKKLYREQFGTDPAPTPRFIDGAIRQVAGYTNAHRHLFDAVWAQINGEAS